MVESSNVKRRTKGNFDDVGIDFSVVKLKPRAASRRE